MKLESDKMRHMHMYGMIKAEIMQLGFFFCFFFSFVSFLVFAHGLALLAEQQKFPYTSHLCLNCVAQFSAFLKDQKKMEFS